MDEVQQSENREQDSKKTGRKNSGVTAGNLHEMVFDFALGHYKFIDDYRYEQQAREHLAEVASELYGKGYKLDSSPSEIQKFVLRATQQLDEENVNHNLEELVIRAKKRELVAKQDDIDKLQEAVSRMGTDFLKRYQAAKRQSKHKNAHNKNQITLKSSTFEMLTHLKGEQTWDEFFWELYKNIGLLYETVNSHEKESVPDSRVGSHTLKECIDALRKQTIT